MKTKFKITYTEPETGETEVAYKEFEDMPGIASAREVAEDWAYAIADKGPYNIESL